MNEKTKNRMVQMLQSDLRKLRAKKATLDRQHEYKMRRLVEEIESKSKELIELLKTHD